MLSLGKLVIFDVRNASVAWIPERLTGSKADHLST